MLWKFNYGKKLLKAQLNEKLSKAQLSKKLLKAPLKLSNNFLFKEIQLFEWKFQICPNFLKVLYKQLNQQIELQVWKITFIQYCTDLQHLIHTNPSKGTYEVMGNELVLSLFFCFSYYYFFLIHSLAHSQFFVFFSLIKSSSRRYWKTKQTSLLPLIMSCWCLWCTKRKKMKKKKKRRDEDA